MYGHTIECMLKCPYTQLQREDKKLRCRIDDGWDEEDFLEAQGREPEDEDDAYERFRQQKIDDGECMSCHRPHEPGDTHCAECNAIANAKCTVCHNEWVDVRAGEDTCPSCLTNV